MADSQKERIMRSLGVSEAEAEEIIAFDKAIDRGERTEYDLDPKKEKEKLNNYSFIVEDLLEQGYQIIPIFSSDYPKTLKRNLKFSSPILARSFLIITLSAFLKYKLLLEYLSFKAQVPGNSVQHLKHPIHGNISLGFITTLSSILLKGVFKNNSFSKSCNINVILTSY